jgi:hypothetical protein
MGSHRFVDMECEHCGCPELPAKTLTRVAAANLRKKEATAVPVAAPSCHGSMSGPHDVVLGECRHCLEVDDTRLEGQSALHFGGACPNSMGGVHLFSPAGECIRCGTPRDRVPPCARALRAAATVRGPSAFATTTTRNASSSSTKEDDSLAPCDPALQACPGLLGCVHQYVGRSDNCRGCAVRRNEHAQLFEIRKAEWIAHIQRLDAAAKKRRASARKHRKLLRQARENFEDIDVVLPLQSSSSSSRTNTSSLLRRSKKSRSKPTTRRARPSRAERKRQAALRAKQREFMQDAL